MLQYLNSTHSIQVVGTYFGDKIFTSPSDYIVYNVMAVRSRNSETQMVP